MSELTLLYTAFGSQFGAKVLTALDACEEPYLVRAVDPRRFKTDLVPPHTVPQLRFRGEENILTDSADILARLAEETGYPFYPTAEASELEQWVGNHLNAHVLYFTFWVEEGWRLSYQRKIAEAIPGPTPLLQWIMRWALPLRRLRGKMRSRARGQLAVGLIAEGRAPDPDEQVRMRASLLSAMQTLEDRFTQSNQQWLLTTDRPSAPDFAAYGVLERLVGNTGDACMGAATPWLFEAANVPSLQAWHTRMQQHFPIKFKGKRGE